ncbi:uncharacterized protein OCT59_017837 [Rhizophagus irregularis]|uniref:uncharacterized protein n=1 Tax=Rhizophagus irregularis TaxID=588596 RepID=UPI00331AADDD|nr:hypothetical protein OCT59_017837 [Rhizophagus irregularis]
MKTEFSKLNISNENSNKDSNLENVSHKNCSYCNKPFTEELWCKKCDPFKMIEGWTSGNNDIDKFIKDTIYSARNAKYKHKLMFLEWVPFDRFEDVKQIGEGGFAKVYSATWINGEAEYDKQDDGSWKKQESRSMEVALKRLNGSQNMSAEYLNETKLVIDISLALEICNGLRPNFGKGTPEVYKKLAYKCMNANSNQRPTAKELYDIIDFWDDSFNKDNQEKEEFGYKRKEIKAMFEEADKEIPNISTSHKKNSDAIYTSRLFSFNNLTKPVNSSIITSYLDDDENNEDNRDSQLVDLEISSSLLQSKDDINDNENSFDE